MSGAAREKAAGGVESGAEPASGKLLADFAAEKLGQVPAAWNDPRVIALLEDDRYEITGIPDDSFAHIVFDKGLLPRFNVDAAESRMIDAPRRRHLDAVRIVDLILPSWPGNQPLLAAPGEQRKGNDLRRRGLDEIKQMIGDNDRVLKKILDAVIVLSDTGGSAFDLYGDATHFDYHVRQFLKPRTEPPSDRSLRRFRKLRFWPAPHP